MHFEVFHVLYSVHVEPSTGDTLVMAACSLSYTVGRSTRFAVTRTIPTLTKFYIFTRYLAVQDKNNEERNI